jgi:hypothetical protein
MHPPEVQYVGSWEFQEAISYVPPRYGTFEAVLAAPASSLARLSTRLIALTETAQFCSPKVLTAWLRH